MHDTLIERCQHAIAFGAQQLRHLVTTHPDAFPLVTANGRWQVDGERWTNWCEGFLGGQLWIVAQQTGDPWFRAQAEHYSRLIEDRKHDRTVHDLGFLFWSTYKRWYDASDDPDERRSLHAVLIEAGRTLALRFQDEGQYLRSFVAPESLFIDIMMNVGIIFYAAQQTGDPALWRVAMQHSLTTRRVLVRGDGSTAHEGIFDPASGAFLRQSTHQGWRGDSCWARGHAWAIYGFTTVADYTQDARFLQTAQACADYYILHTPEHGVPPNDWDEPDPAQPVESSAAAITASGLFDLARATADPLRAQVYRDYALRIVSTLTGPDFLADATPGWEGILKHGIYHQRKALGVDESVMWGDYFFLEAVAKTLEALHNDG